MVIYKHAGKRLGVVGKQSSTGVKNLGDFILIFQQKHMLCGATKKLNIGVF